MHEAPTIPWGARESPGLPNHRKSIQANCAERKGYQGPKCRVSPIGRAGLVCMARTPFAYLGVFVHQSSLALEGVLL
eukprot:12501982-Alexandrium_andersonii.AAC.1